MHCTQDHCTLDRIPYSWPHFCAVQCKCCVEVAVLEAAVGRFGAAGAFALTPHESCQNRRFEVKTSPGNTLVYTCVYPYIQKCSISMQHLKSLSLSYLSSLTSLSSPLPSAYSYYINHCHCHHFWLLVTSDSRFWWSLAKNIKMQEVGEETEGQVFSKNCLKSYLATSAKNSIQ